MPNRIDDQARAIVRTQALIAQLQASIAETSQGGKAITGTEAQQLIGQAAQLPKDQLKDLKSAILERLTAKDHWECTADARTAFASFLGVPPEKLPAAVDLKPGMSAMSRKVKNEELPASVSKKEMAEILKGTEELPDELRRMVTASLLGMQKEGKIKLDPESRKQFTRAVVETYGNDGPDAYLGYRANSSLQTNASGNLLAEVLASGGSFEEILFAFLLMMADKAEKKAIEKMEELARIEEGNRDGRPGGPHGGDRPFRPGQTEGAGKPDLPGKPDKPGPASDTKQVARTLEAMVQSAHWATDNRSDGGTQVTGKEVARLVGYLDRLPDNVQKLLAGSFENALKVGIPITGDAHAAIKGWCEKQLGRPLDLSSAPKPGESNWQDSAVCRRLQGSELLEDRIALFVVNTLYQPDKQLKEKMAPFKALRDGVTTWAQSHQTGEVAPMPDNVGAELDAAKKAADAGGQLPPIPQAVKDAAAAVAPRARAKKPSPTAASVQPADRPDLAAATTPTASADRPAKSGKAGKSAHVHPGHEPLRDPKLNQDILSAAKTEARPGEVQTPAGPEKANDEISQFFDHDPKHVGPAGKSDVRAQNELQIAINERQRVFEMLSNMMKAIHEMQMTSIRNLR